MLKSNILSWRGGWGVGGVHVISDFLDLALLDILQIIWSSSGFSVCLWTEIVMLNHDIWFDIHFRTGRLKNKTSYNIVLWINAHPSPQAAMLFFWLPSAASPLPPPSSEHFYTLHSAIRFSKFVIETKLNKSHKIDLWNGFHPKIKSINAYEDVCFSDAIA